MSPPDRWRRRRRVEASIVARLEELLRARADGEGTERFVEVFSLSPSPENDPLMYTTTTGAPFERFEITVARGPSWPDGDFMRFEVLLFAEGGETVVEQEIIGFPESSGGGTLRLEVGTTTENGQPVPST